MTTMADIQQFVQLTVSSPLDDPRVWFKNVKENTPSGVMATVQVSDKTGARISVPMVLRKIDGKCSYIIPLSRNLSEEESAKIVEAFVLDQDYDIETSVSAPVAKPGYEAEIDTKPYDDLCMALAKREHDRWMKERTDAGWRYGIAMDFDAKTNPLLVPWEQLPEKQRKPDQDSPQAVIDLLAAQGYVMIQKSEIEMLTTLMRGLGNSSFCQ